MYNQKPLSGDLLDYGDPLSRGIVGFWLMNEGSGNKVFDLSGGNIGTVTGATWGNGKFGSVIVFNGSSDGIQFGMVLTNGVDFTIFAVVKFVDDTSRNIIIARNTSPDDKQWSIEFNVALKIDIIYFNGSVATILTSTRTFSENTWYSVAITFDYTNGVIRLYVDGKEETLNSSTLVGSGGEGDPILQIGQLRATQYLNGTVDHVSIYNHISSASEIALLYREPFRMIRTKRRRIGAVGEDIVAPPTGIVVLRRRIEAA